MDDASEFLWRMYSENTTHVRHVETQRSTVTSVLLTLAGAVLALIAVQLRGNQAPHLGLSVLLILVGLMGSIFTGKLYELYIEHKQRARTFRRALARRIPEAQVEELKAEADVQWKKDAPLLRPLPVHLLWMGPHILTVLLGLVLLAFSATGTKLPGKSAAGSTQPAGASSAPAASAPAARP